MAKDVIIIDNDCLYFLRGDRKQSLYSIAALHSLRCEDAPMYKREGGEVILSEECISSAIKLFQEKLNIRLNEADLILPPAITWFSYLAVEEMPKTEKEAEEFIIWKVQKIMPIPREQVILRYQILSRAKDRGTVLIAATFNNFVKSIENAFKKMGILVTGLTPPTIAFLNFFEQSLPKNCVLCWLRESSYSMVCLYDGFPVVIREVDRAVNVKRIEAELFSFVQSVKEGFPDYNFDAVFFFDELQREELVNNFPETAKKLEYKKFIQESDCNIIDLPKYISALGIIG
ncbi:MAG: hypothetical protein OHK0040_12150 [bacterium]